MMDKPVAVVTGGARGIGAAIADALLGAGFAVAIADMDLATAEALVASRGLPAGEFRAYALNVTDEGGVAAVFKQLQADFGRIDVLVNNAGINQDNLIMRMKIEQWQRVLDVNLTGTFLCTRAVIPVMMRQRAGRIINIASVVGEMGNAGQANYCATKAGLIGFTKAVAREVASRNITVNAVAPGYIDTEMTRNLPEAVKQEFGRNIALGRPGQPEDVAHAVTFLAGPGAAYITGFVLDVNGGMYM
ncbi:MAG TPA: 3-oxoacyl-[acyl-carrier-protein] reductase [Acidobacteriota bacterium]|nr:3-oxoacyl-[acyl-carrier-protein] reductase [Acidobacteriota bacterium]HNU00630.1 3-oxoacyl-[acyl-carrier-protein] reductase [Acidobacteriota bacterium]